MVEILKGILGSFFLIGATDMIGRLFWKREDGLSGRWLSWLVSFFTIVTPLFYILNLLKLQINYYSVVSILILIWFGTGIIFRRKIFEFEKIKIKGILFWLLAYFAIHLIFYSIYFTIPEWDSYSNIMTVRENILIGSMLSNYRPLFNASMTIVSILSNVNPYVVFPVFLILVQSSLLLSIYLISKGAKSKLIKGLLFAGAIAVPVINLEIDIPRPQSILIALMPIFFYYLNKYSGNKKEIGVFLLSFWISTVGLLYHEFFIGLLFISLLLTGQLILREWMYGDKKDKTIISLVLLVSILLIFLGYDHVFTIKYALGLISDIVNNFLQKFNWRWWFLNDDLSVDGVSVAWIGFKSTLMYYGYYLSPIIFGWFVILASYFYKIRKLEKIHLSLIVIWGLFFSFAEILPRMGIGILPERFWIFTDIATLLLVACIVKNIKISIPIKIVLLIFTFISLSGSFAVVIGKKSLTSANEMKAAIWIKHNTPKEARFVSQEANNKLIVFFGERKMIFPNSDFFLSDKLIDQNRTDTCTVQNTVAITSAKNKLLGFDIQYGNINNLYSIVNDARTKITNTNKTCMPDEMIANTPIYVLFSDEKLDGLYSTRKWWRDVNFYDANLDKFDTLPLVYDYDGVRIWKLK